jgi:O-antigen/teichoic acid export membrane protein
MPRFQFRRIFSLIALAAPVGVGMFWMELRDNYPRIVLAEKHSASELAFFGTMAYLSFAVGVIVQALGQSAAPRLADYFVYKFHAFRQLLAKLGLIALVLGVVYVAGIALIGEPVMRAFFGPEYAEHPVDLVLIAIAGAISFPLYFGGVALATARAVRVYLYAGLASCASSFVGTFLLVRPYGIRGASINLIISSAVSLIFIIGGLYVAIRKRSEEPDAVQPVASSSSPASK